jgi:hypothetical protein
MERISISNDYLFLTSVLLHRFLANFTVGLAMNLWSSDLNSLAGELQWGATPRDAYQGAL